MTTVDGMMQVRIKRISFEAESINSYELVAPAGGELASFTAGSHIDLHLPNGMIRSYSLVNDQSERSRYVVAVKREGTPPWDLSLIALDLGIERMARGTTCEALRLRYRYAGEDVPARSSAGDQDPHAVASRIPSRCSRRDVLTRCDEALTDRSSPAAAIIRQSEVDP